jgi:hypothetical protein
MSVSAQTVSNRRLLVRRVFASSLLIALVFLGCAEWTRRNSEIKLAIATLSPSSIPVGADSQILTIRGNGFLSTSTVSFNGIAHKATFIDPSQLSLQLSKAELQKVRDFSVAVANGAEAATQYLRIEGGTLKVLVTGLPMEQQGNISVTYPGGSSYRIYSAQALQVPPGTYQVFGYGVGIGGSNYYSEPAVQSVTIEDGSSSSVEVWYKAVTFKLAQIEDPKAPNLRMMLTY